MENLVIPSDRVKPADWDFTKLKTVVACRPYLDDVLKIDRLLEGKTGATRSRFIRQLIREALLKYDIPNYQK